MNISKQTIIKLLVVVGGAILLTFFLFEFAVKGSITIQGGEGTVNVTVKNIEGQTIATSTDRTIRLLPGSYIVDAQNDRSGISKQVQVGPLSSATLQLPESQIQEARLVAKTALYGIIRAGNKTLGFDPTDEKIKRVTNIGSLTPQLYSSAAAGNKEEWHDELPDTITSYKPYRPGSAIVASGGKLYALTDTESREISLEGIPTDHSAQLIVATNPSSDSFMVAFGQDVYRYASIDGQPEKIYTAKKSFNSLVYGNNIIGLYASDVPYSKEDPRSRFDNYQIDALFIDITSKAESTAIGPMLAVTINPAGNRALVQPRDQAAYLYDIQAKKRLTEVPQPNPAGPYWVNDTNYLYSRGALLWEYDTAQNAASQISRLPHEITSISTDSLGGYWLTTFNDTDDAAIYRIGGQDDPKPSAAAEKLSSILPYTDGTMELSFSQSETPTVIIRTFAPLNNENQINRYKEETVALRQKALKYLTDAGVDLTGVAIIYDPADPL